MLLNRNFLWCCLVAFLGILALGLGLVPVADAAGDVEGLRARAEARWQALIAGDFDKAYEFETPAYRQVYNPKQYRARFGSGLRWQQARVVKVDLKSPEEVAIVTLEIDYSFHVAGKGMMDSKGSVTETWLWVEGQWWHQFQ